MKMSPSLTPATSTPGKYGNGTPNQADNRTSLDYYFKRSLSATDGANRFTKTWLLDTPAPTPRKRPHPGPEPQHQSPKDAGINPWKKHRAIPSEQQMTSSSAKKSKHEHTEERVVPEHQWKYQIKYMESTKPITDEEKAKENATNDRSFANRKQANEYLDKKASPEVIGGLESIVRRTVSMEGPERLLKVRIELQSGEHHLMWVERSLKPVRKLEMKQLGQTPRRPVSRPKIPHYVVTCDLVNDNRVYTQRRDADGKYVIGEEAVETEHSVTIEKFTPRTFTSREMANKHAGQLFLEQSRVPRETAGAEDELWWQNHAVLRHEQGLRDAKKGDGLFEATMGAEDMKERLGWDQIVVLVQMVDDITGPVNF
ncbi:hypothetical protein F4861DRAFT_489720 [Xylaria intraflava]|nr:hypothetical protein F4861DRAFT_489720 [Xylaria intraflava]